MESIDSYNWSTSDYIVMWIRPYILELGYMLALLLWVSQLTTLYFILSNIKIVY